MFEFVDLIAYPGGMCSDREETPERSDSNMLVHQYLKTTEKVNEEDLIRVLPLANRSNSKQACALDCVEDIPANI